MRALITIFTLLIITAISHHHIVNVETLWLVSDGDVKSLMLIPAQYPDHKEDDAEQKYGEVGGEVERKLNKIN